MPSQLKGVSRILRSSHKPFNTHSWHDWLWSPARRYFEYTVIAVRNSDTVDYCGCTVPGSQGGHIADSFRDPKGATDHQSPITLKSPSTAV
jgi:hypothetical protein